jgi:chemotaxis protein MotB
MGKRKNNEEGPGKDVGMVINISLFLILLTFFILLNSIAIQDDKKMRNAIGSLAGSFGRLKGDLSTMKTGSSRMPASHTVAAQKANLEKLINGMDSKINEHTDLQTGKGGEILTIGEKALFHQNRHTLKPGSIALLKKLGDFINQGEYPVEIVGHTDNLDTEEKGYRSNRELSSLMAVQVQKYIIEECKVRPDRITACGYGSERPVVSNDTPESMEKNRRIEIIFKDKSPVHSAKIYSESPSGILTYKRFNFKVY